MNLFGLVSGVLVGILLYPWFGPIGVLFGVVLGALADASGRGRSGGAFGGETRELLVRLFALWGRVTALSGAPSQGQVLFLQGVVATQLQIRGSVAREAFDAFQRSVVAAQGLSFTPAFTAIVDLAREIYEDFFLDRRTLVWIYATARRLGALGTVRPGLIEVLDGIAKAFSIFEEVGSAGVEGSSAGDRYEQAWQNFRPASTAGPEAYATLGLAPSATVDEIKKAYRQLVRVNHPDSHSHLEDAHPERRRASERFLQVQQAYERIRKDRKF